MYLSKISLVSCMRPSCISSVPWVACMLRKVLLRKLFWCTMYLYIYGICTCISINHTLRKFKSICNKFFIQTKKFLVILRVDFRERERELWHLQHSLSFLVETCKDTTVGLEKTNWRSQDLFPASLWCVVNRTPHCEMLAALSEKCLETCKIFFIKLRIHVHVD